MENKLFNWSSKRESILAVFDGNPDYSMISFRTWLEQSGVRWLDEQFGRRHEDEYEDEGEGEEDDEYWSDALDTSAATERAFTERRFAFESWFPSGQDRIYIPFKSNVSEDDDSDLEGDDSDIVELINDFKGGGKYPESEDGYEVVDYAKGLAAPKKVIDKYDTPEKFKLHLQTKKKNLSPEKIDQIVADKFGVSEAQRNLYKIRGILDQIKNQEESKIKSKLDNQEVSQNKYNYLSNKQAEYMDDIIRWFEMSPSRSGSGKSKEYAIVISKNPEDLENMSTGRSWSSCMEIGKGGNYGQVYCEIKDGGFIAYLTTPDDKEIENPKSRVLIRRLDSKTGNPIAVVEESIYGWEVPGFVQEVKKWVESKQGKIKIGEYQLKGAEHSDTFGAKEMMLPDNVEDLFKLAEAREVTESDKKDALIKLKDYANKHGIKEAGDVPSIFERWVKNGTAEKMGITPEDAKRARELWDVKFLTTASETEQIKKEALSKLIAIDKGTPLDTKSAKRLYDLLFVSQPYASVLGTSGVNPWGVLETHPELLKLHPELVNRLLDDKNAIFQGGHRLKKIYSNLTPEQQNRIKETITSHLMQNMKYPPMFDAFASLGPSEYEYLTYYNDLIDKAEILSPIPYPVVKKIMEVADELYKMPLTKMTKMREAGSRVSAGIEEKILQSFANLLSNTKTPAASHFVGKYLNFRGSKGFDYGSWSNARTPTNTPANTWFSTLVNMGEKAKQFLPQLKTELKNLEDKLADLDAEGPYRVAQRTDDDTSDGDRGFVVGRAGESRPLRSNASMSTLWSTNRLEKRRMETAREEYLYTIDSIEKGRPSQKYYPFQTVRLHAVESASGQVTAR
jgi:hypothetical protein